jgi:hypothetical protein
MELEMTKKNAAQPVQKSPGNGPNLDSRYGEIGISAVAAALHYKSVAKNPAYAPVVPRPDQRSEEMAEIAA